MKWLLRAILVAVPVIGVLIAWYLFSGPTLPDRRFTAQGDAENGQYLLKMGGCMACHGVGLAGGAPLETSFGTFHPPNITPDPDHGLGGWTLQDFGNALTLGHGPDGTKYYPAFPYTSYSRLTEQDVADLWAAIRTFAPVAEDTPDHTLATALGARWVLTPWQSLYFRPRPFEPDPERGATWNRGAYIVTGLGHCGECHTPRGSLGGKNPVKRLAGNKLTPTGESAPDITGPALKARGWTPETLAQGLATGMRPDGTSMTGTMAEVVTHATSHLTAEDRAAIAEYLFSGPPRMRRQPPE